MCGILGILHRQAQHPWPSFSGDALAKLAHRGPDGSGVLSDSHIQLGHTRLSIIDLSEGGHQPMTFAHGRYSVTFNGEIYNHLELRRELEQRGEQFNSHSDTEVLLAAYKTWGSECIHKFIGPFAFAIWDHEKQIAFLARDRCGERPLFYHFDQTRLTFASELKALIPLLREIPSLDAAAVDMYLHYQFVPEPKTLLAGVHKLAAGHTLTLALDSWDAHTKRYWSAEPVDNEGLLAKDKSSTINESNRNGLEDAVKMTLRADVPIGIALSGGVDSSAIAAFAQRNYPEPMHAFCVGYPGRPKYDERAQARSFAESLGMIVHEVELPVDNCVDFFPQLVRIMDEPIADPAAFGHYSIPAAAKEQGIKVLLSGVGGDELFWGYPYVTQAVQINQLVNKYHTIASLANLLSGESAQTFLTKVAHYPHASPTVRRWADTLQKIADPHQPAEQLLYYLLHPDFSAIYPFKDRLYGPAMQRLKVHSEFSLSDIGKRKFDQIPAAIIRLLFETWLVSNCLSLGDRVSMGVGVETRMPFLDARLINRVMSLRQMHPDHNLGQKFWLRQCLEGVLPTEILKRPKAGFQPPVHDWLSGVVQAYHPLLKSGFLEREGVIAADQIEYIHETLAHKNYAGLFLAYKLVLLEIWYRQVVAQ